MFNKSNRPNRRESDSGFDSKVIKIKRVSKKTKGGNQIGFTALVAVGDGAGKLGVALAKAKDVGSAIRKAMHKAEKIMVKIALDSDIKTIPYPLEIKFKATKLMLKPARAGTGLIAGGAARSTLEVSGVANVVAKILGSRNQTSVAYAVFEAFKQFAGEK